MIKSNFIADVVDLLLDGDADGIEARPQIALIADTLFGYTSSGLFVTFSHPENISPYKCAKDDLVLKGVKITSVQFQVEAEATLYFKKGIIDHIEISCSRGNYPRQDLPSYTLTQIIAGLPGKQIVKE